MSHALIARIRARSSMGSEDGFTLIEVLVAAGIMLTALLALAYTTTVALSYTSFSRQRQGASGLMNQAMEQVAALPFATLESGLDNTDLANSLNARSSSYDPDIHTTGCGGASGYCYGSEPIPHGSIVGAGQLTCTSTTLPHPLVPHGCPTTVGVTSYTVRVYVTNYIPPGGTLDLTSHTYRVTVVVSWAHSQVGGVLSKETTQKIFFSSTGCLSSGTHPFAAPCQPFLYGTAGVQPGVVQVSGSIGTTVLDSGGILASREFSSDMQVEQITAVQGYSQTAAVSETTGDGTVESVGPLKVTSGADSDPAQPGHEYNSNTSTAALTGGPIDISGDGGHLSLSASGTDSLTTVSTTAAAATQSPACANVSGTNQADNQPCGSSTTTRGAATSVSMTLTGGVSLSTVLGSVSSATGTDIAYTKRLVAPSGTVCPTTSGDGCVHAEASRAIGTVTLGSLPSGVAPNGSWLGYLVQITGFTDHVTAEAGVGFAAPAATASGTIKSWTGSGYATCTISTNCPATITTIAVTVTTADGAVISIPAATLTVGVPSTATTANNCTTPCVFRSAASPSPLTGDIVYDVSKGGSPLAALTIHVNLGELDAKATYKPVTAS
jgi:type II secretory pathway pseudopilin PulG